MNDRLLRLPGVLLLSGLASCASPPADWGRSEVAHLAADRGRALPVVADAQAYTRAALRDPLSAECAVQLALINNPSLRRETARLGFAAADLYEAGRLSNPLLSAARLSPGDAGAAHAQLSLGIAFNFLDLLFLPARQRHAGARFEAAKLEAAAAVFDLAAEVESAWYEAVGTQQLARMREAASRAAAASAELAQRYFDAGNLSRRELAMEQAAASQALLASLSAGAKAAEAHGRLNTLMGLGADQDGWTLDARLAEPLQQDDPPEALQQLGQDSRLDLAALRRNAQALADRHGFTRRTRWVGGIEVGVERERDYDGAINVGPTLSLELPLFNMGGGRVAAARAALEQAEADLDERVLEVSNEVRLAAARVASARKLAETYRLALIPQRETVVAQAQAEQNYMLIGVFELILAKQQEYEAYAGYIEAVRDYWIARAELSRAVGRRLPSSDQPAPPTLDPVELLRPRDGNAPHHMHHKAPASGATDGSDGEQH